MISIGSKNLLTSFAGSKSIKRILVGATEVFPGWVNQKVIFSAKQTYTKNAWANITNWKADPNSDSSLFNSTNQTFSLAPGKYIVNADYLLYATFNDMPSQFRLTSNSTPITDSVMTTTTMRTTGDDPCLFHYSSLVDLPNGSSLGSQVNLNPYTPSYAYIDVTGTNWTIERYVPGSVSSHMGIVSTGGEKVSTSEWGKIPATWAEETGYSGTVFSADGTITHPGGPVKIKASNYADGNTYANQIRVMLNGNVIAYSSGAIQPTNTTYVMSIDWAGIIPENSQIWIEYPKQYYPDDNVFHLTVDTITEGDFVS